ncbi:extracellular solute-binding protein [Paenibacillus sp. LMG 31459]|uniref:Extracellular solute-binding protein n=1 Tax=Paenibacillus phytohabitans TaxID=2654978 RepID=A0ABX1YEM8_9BACL|nr:extracellular solute-binding protein [Paenibacillus phytohabitans]NOU79442.1 extracellular solute-binding protein [Paenibacillus phytohabitans]
MNLNKSRRWLAGILMLSIALSGVTGCAANKEGKANSSAGEEADPGEQTPMKLTVMLPSFKTTMPEDDSPVVTEIEKLTNTDIHLEWVPDSSYNEKFNITLASGKIPGVMLVKEKSPSFINAVRAGAFWEMGPYLKDYPNLSQTSAIVNNNISIDGKIYGIYRGRALGRNGIVYRKDWLDNLGLQAPQTIDDFYQMLKAFTTGDPDQNGKDDTYGMVITKFNGPFEVMQTWFGAANKWGLDDTGKLIPAHTTEAYMEALRFFRKLYEEKLINADFAVMDSSKWPDPIVNGQAGALVDVTDHANRIEEKIHAALEKAGKDDESKIFMDTIGAVSGPKGLRALPTSGYSGLFAISKSSVKTEDQLRQVLNFLDKLNEEKGQRLAGNGIEGRHYTFVDGNLEASKDEALLESEASGLNQLLMYLPEDRTLKLKASSVKQKSEAVQKANESIVVTNPAEPFVSDVYSQKGPQLDVIINDARTKFVVGQIDEDGFKAAVELWQKSGGVEYVKEINELYQAASKQ